MSGLKIAIISKLDRAGGGASKSCELLAGALRQRGVEARWFVVQKMRVGGAAQQLLGPVATALTTFVHKWNRRVFGGEFVPMEWWALRRLAPQFDVIHLSDHWQAVSPWSMRWLVRRRPTVITLHDASFFTGGCLYPFECHRFEHACGRCPQQAAIGMPVDLTRPSLWAKRTIAADPRFELIASSAWMADLVARSRFRGLRTAVVFNAADPAIFNPAVRGSARWCLGLETNDRIVMLAANALSDPRKGIPLAVEALNRLADLRLTVLLMGRFGGEAAVALRHPCRVLNYVADDASLARAYAAADLFVFPSLTDNCPLSVIESMAVGTPVIAFDRGGTPELIRSGVDGEVLSRADSGELANRIRSLITDPDGLSRRGAAAAQAARERFSLRQSVDQHLAVYERAHDARYREL